MPGFLGGSTGGTTGTGGEITFPREFIDPVTKLRVSEPQTMIDTDFEYGLQPTKWETVELINNTPSFFSKGGDTTIPNITAITTNAGTREITVNTLLDHSLSVGIPINVTGTKSVTADGSYIIASIPTTTSFTYLCKDNQITTISIEDLYTSIITGEFFQGSQIRVSDSAGITTDGTSISTLTVTTDSAHGFKVDTPFYFLNLNSTISQEFQASNATAKSFDSSNSATAQTFDGSNTLSSVNIDWSNSATVGGVTSSIASVNTTTDTITVTHTTENFNGRTLGTPLYYNVVSASGFFATNPRGVVFLNSTTSLGTGTSSFTVSDVPGGSNIDLIASMTGTFQLANQARTFAGNNTNAATQTTVSIVKDSPLAVDAANNGGVLGAAGTFSTVASYSGSLVNVTSDSGANVLDYYIGAMLKYTTTGAAANGLINNATYWVDSIFQSGTTANYAFTLRTLPSGAAGSTVLTSITGGTGTQKFQKIGVSVDKDVFHVRNNGFAAKDMLYYSYPTGGRFTAATAGETKDYYFVESAFDAHNFTLTTVLGVAATGGTVTSITDGGIAYTVHSFTSTGATNFVVTSPGTVDILLVAGGGGGGSWVGGGGGAGGVVLKTDVAVTAQTYSIVVGDGGAGGINPGSYVAPFPSTGQGENSTGLGFTALGGGKGGSWSGDQSTSGGSGGGSSHQNATTAGLQPGSASGGFGNAGGPNNGFGGGGPHATSGGGGAGGAGQGTVNDLQSGAGGAGRSFTTRTGAAVFYGGGGGGGMHGPGYDDTRAGLGSRNSATGGGGNGKHRNNSLIADQAGVSNTGGGGGGGGAPGNEPSYGGKGGSGIVVIRYKA